MSTSTQEHKTIKYKKFNKIKKISSWYKDVLSRSRTSTPKMKKYKTNSDLFRECEQNDLVLSKLYIIRDHTGKLLYGDLDVKQGDIVHLICESDEFYFVQDQFGMQGFVPADVTVDLDEVLSNAQLKNIFSNQNKITSL
jgi:hypothetical protein